MGAKISVCNLTAIAINVALKQLGPVYYHNQLQNGTCAVFNTGRVWFTIEARVWLNGTNNYNDAMMALPIAGAVLGATSLAGVAGSIAQIATRNTSEEKSQEEFKMKPIFGLVPLIPTIPIAAAGAIVNEIKKPEPKLIATLKNVYMKDRRMINVEGGPNFEDIDVKFDAAGTILHQNIKKGADYPPLKISISELQAPEKQ